MILLDATEARSNTRLPQAVIAAAQVVDGFESLTGADILISPLSSPRLPDKLTDCLPHRKMLAIHTRAGVLIQRKDGRDLVNSIPDLCRIEKKMMDWCGKINPWLLVVGTFSQPSERLLINGRKMKPCYNIKSIYAALDWWRLRGGNVTEVQSANHVTAWINHWHESMLHKLNTEPDKLVVDRPPAQSLATPGNDWWMPMITLPGIGPVKAQVLAQWLPECWQKLAYALCYLSDSANVKLDRPPGFGRKTFAEARRVLGLDDNDVMIVQEKSK